MFYKLDRFSTIHKVLRIMGNNLLWILPTRLKYWVGVGVRRRKLPYSLVEAGDVVVQLGAPWDLLKAGRSRAITFSRIVGPAGRVVVVEPDPGNVEELQRFIKSYDVRNVTLVPKGAWSESGQLKFLTDPEHPASNLLAEVYDDTRLDREKYEEVIVPVETLPSILKECDVKKVKLLSMTTNGAEVEILKGCEDLGFAEFISVVGKREWYSDLDQRGFDFKEEDDRGFLFRRREK